MPFFALLIPAVVKVVCTACVAVGAAYCTHKVVDAYKKGQDTKQRAITAKSQTDLTKIQVATEDNKKVQAESNEWKKKYEELDWKEKVRETEIKNVREELKDPNLSNKKREELEEKLAILLAQQDNDKREKDKILDKIKDLAERNKKNNQTINTTGSGSYENAGRHWIWEFLTFENILIMGACYMLYQIVLKDDRR